MKLIASLQLCFVFAMAAAADLPIGLSSPDYGVVCHASRAVCYDRYGPSIGLTEAFLGREAAERLTTTLRQNPPDNRPGASFSPADGVECQREVGPCRVGGTLHQPLSTVLYTLPSRPSHMTAEYAAIVGVDWQWQVTRYSNDTQAVPQDPARYRLRLEADGALRVTADCNQAGGRYRVDRSTIAIEVMPTTMAACAPGSLDAVFRRDLAAATIFFMRTGDLYLDLKYDTGTMQFGR